MRGAGGQLITGWFTLRSSLIPRGAVKDFLRAQAEDGPGAGRKAS